MEDKKQIKSKGFQLENTYIQLPDILFAKQNPSDVPNPKFVLFNDALAKTLGLDEAFLKNDEGLQILSGNGILEGTTPIAQAYAGHQFGYFTMLGDGRAVLLGEYVSREGARLDMQLKGSGRTPYSRRGDGKAALSPMLREYIISEGMHALGIPTTRSLAVVSTGEVVRRETPLLGAVLTRIAKSHIRVGTFQYVSKWGSLDDLKALADYTLNRHFEEGLNQENPYLYLLDEVIKKQARLIAKWQLVGFIHGVMNTDNMAISGETIDYGPCAFMDTYHLETVFSSIDTEGRYAYQNQPSIAGWNLARFAETLLPLLHEDQDTAIQIAQKSISHFGKLYKENWTQGMRKKLGLFNEEAVDEHLIEALLSMMQKYKADYTNTFRNLTLNQVENGALYEAEEFKKWYTLWQERLSRQEASKDAIRHLMEKNNPHIIPRNHRVEEALEAATRNEDYSVIVALLEVMTHPYDYSKLNEHYATLPEATSCPYKTYCGT